jgi:acyl-CoA synthetase (AMP-forming)/AMP-acid ligase II
MTQQHPPAAANPHGAPVATGGVAFLAQAARTFADRRAIVSDGATCTYREALHRIRELAVWSRAAMPAGSAVVIFMRNGVDAALLPLALAESGLVRVPVNWRMSALELANVVTMSGAALLVHDRDTASVAADALQRARAAGFTECGLAAIEAVPRTPPAGFEPPSDPDEHRIDDTTLASITFTSGTLGVPKGVMLSHRNWEFVYRNLLAVRDFRATDVIALMGPLSHASGAYVVPALLCGSTIVLPTETAADRVAAAIEQHGVTVLQCVPTLITRLLQSEHFCEVARRSLRLIIYGAESMPYGTLKAAIDRFGPILAQNYGLTEATMTCATLPPDEHLAVRAGVPPRLRHGTVGRPYPFVEIVVRGKDGAEVPQGEVGEITVRAPHVMMGYWRNPEATAAALRGGWLWTGDLARWTDDGYLELAGRSKDMIISGGMNMYPAEVQAYLTQLPNVREACVFGTSSSEWGEVLVGALVLAEDTPELRDRLRAQARADLGIRTPKIWIHLQELPRTANGKLDVAALRRQVGPPA